MSTRNKKFATESGKCVVLLGGAEAHCTEEHCKFYGSNLSNDLMFSSSNQKSKCEQSEALHGFIQVGESQDKQMKAQSGMGIAALPSDWSEGP